jgi:hypothetical protein
MSDSILTSLLDRQRNLRHLRLTLDGLGDAFTLENTLSRPLLSSLDITVTEASDLALVTRMFILPGSKLKRLTIGLNPDEYLDLRGAFESAATTLPVLEEFALINVHRRGDLSIPWPSIPNFHLLKRLTLCRCDMADDFLRWLAHDTSDTGCKLEHLAFEVHHVTESILSLLESCTSLSSLYIRLAAYDDSQFDRIINSTRKIGSRLGTLTLQDSRGFGNREPFSNQHRIRTLCEQFCNLRYLGLRVDVDLLEDNCQGALASPLLTSLSLLSRLRVVHFRWGRFYPNASSLRSVEEKMQMFCQGIFTYMDEYHACISLRAIVLGHHLYNYDDDGEYVSGEEIDMQYSRYCFIRGRQTDALGRTKTVAVLVPASIIRKLEPECNLLDFDWDSDYRGSYPGRLRFD